MSRNDRNYEELARYCKVDRNVSFKQITTLRIGGTARYVAYPESLLELDQIMRVTKELNLPTKVFGKGSNMLCSDKVFEGVIIRFGQPLAEFYFDGEECVAQAGSSLIALSYEAMKQSLSGLEFASGIPGSVGGALFMNAGAYKSAMSEIVKEVMVYRDEKFEWISSAECDFSYRHSVFQCHSDWIIVAARLKLTAADKNEIEELMTSRRERRLESQPLEYPCAGSVFRNPETIPAWQVIDELGYRGKRIGGALVSPKHVNFIINENNATAQDFLSLVEMIQKDAEEKMGYHLRMEVEKFNW